jgi:cellulose synthase operon protein C
MAGRSRYWSLLVAAFILPGPACAQQDGTAADAAFREGRYDDAIRIGNSALRGDPADSVARKALARALLEVGRYDEVIEAAGDLHLIRGEALRARGRLADAETAFREAIADGGPDRLIAEFHLGELLYRRGDRADAMARFDSFIDVYNRSERLSARDLTAVGNAVWYLGSTEPALFHDAVMAFDEATREDPTDIEPHIRLGELFVEKYNSPEALQALTDALALNPQNPRALLAMARAVAFEGERGRAAELAQQALAVNPNLIGARVFLARLRLDAEDYDAAEEEIRQALDVNPASLEALSTLAALHYIRENVREYEEVRSRVRELNPSYSGLLTTVAEIAAQVRRYEDAAELAAEAVGLDPGAWNAHAVLGLNQFRLGRIEEATQSLERSFAGDPYNVWIKNNLDLLDTFENYEIRTVGGIELMLHRDEADLLYPYLAEAAVEAHGELTRRYGDTPRGPVRIELYPRSADFSVRTVGLAGLGALGVSFGDVVALDSPAARAAGSYNWVTTLWHEIAHTVALGVSNSRVPRWFTEGLSVLEERRVRPGWGHHVSPEFLIVYDEGELPPVSRLNEGFIRPRTPAHIGHAYHMASLVTEWIEETHGFDALVRMLRGYADGRSTDEVFRSVLRAEPEAIDDQFDAWLRARTNPETAREFMQLFSEGRRQLEAGNTREAQQSLEAAAALFPTAQGASPLAVLAQLHLRNGNEAAAIEALRSLTEYDETAYSANLELARLLEAAGDREGTLEALERAVWIYPYEVAPHIRLAELAGELGRHDVAVRERQAVIGLRPTDRADAYYQLARALLDAGDPVSARREVMRALEVAPGFDQAQQLLLRIHEAS